jgi:signal transduction histidine kinase/ActR/RegA family two-component response regulator
MLGELGRWLFDSSELTAHGFCLLWEPGLIWTYAISDTLIGLAYFSIPVALAVVARRRRDLVFRPLLWLFAAFILLCGTTHWLELITLWAPAYGTEAVVKAATALVSTVTAVSLWRLMPMALALPSPAQYREANAALRDSQERLNQAQKMEAVGQLTGGIAHDFNNMLQAIGSGLTLLERRVAEGRIEAIGRYIAAIRQAADSAASLTNRLLAFSRRQALQPVAVDPDRLVAGMEDLIRRTLGPAIRLDLHLRDGVWKALTDPNQLESALLNLAINARDAMPDGGTLTISTADRVLSTADVADHDGATAGAYVEIAVSDSGAGMSPEILARAFEPFFTTKPIGQGTGLGLSQVYGFVRQTGGVVELESAPGRGTTVRLCLPRLDESLSPTFERSDPKRVASASFDATGKTVLIVEDVDSVRSQIVETLRELGCRVVHAADGPAGLEALDSIAELDLLITDIGLPGMNGRQLAEAARRSRAELPVLFVTGYAGSALDPARLAPGMEILAKPFALDALAARVSAMLEGETARD